MSSIAARIAKQFTCSARASSPLVCGSQRGLKSWYSTAPFDGDNGGGSSLGEDLLDDIIPEKRELSPQGVNPRRGWNFRGVHKAIICGKVGQTPVQKLLRNGKTLTIFSVGTGGMWDARSLDAKDLDVQIFAYHCTVRLIKSVESASSIPFEELRQGLQ